MMTLGKYLTETQTRQSDFAASIGVAQATVSRLVGGSMTPSLELATKIKRVTQGLVDYDAWVTCEPNPNKETSHDKASPKPAPDAA